MTIGRVCSRELVTASLGEPVSDVARRLCERHVGAVIVTGTPADRPVPLGIVTDRDILRAQIARKAELTFLNVEEVMSRDPLVLEEHLGLIEGVERMRARGVRRAPVVDHSGALVGLVSTDDIVDAISSELAGLAHLIASQPGRESDP